MGRLINYLYVGVGWYYIIDVSSTAIHQDAKLDQILVFEISLSKSKLLWLQKVFSFRIEFSFEFSPTAILTGDLATSKWFQINVETCATKRPSEGVSEKFWTLQNRSG